MLLLCYLPSSFKSFKKTLIYDRDKLSFEDAKGHFLSKDKLDNDFCSNNKEDSKEDVAGANLAEESGDDFLFVSTSDSSELTSKCILDSGCSFHMCPNRE
ncbi:hypothetical protein Godav_005987 [Gossypium davidsonii]|uniref:Uncharacterized protein n=1 Tax=Gossypium davidsonii TaxID=34287 RepID=A0A7J8S367_GOSDV|nr:hypothetical protein [Gossypium davidsonii]